MENFQLTENKKIVVKKERDDTRMVKQVIYMLVAVVVLFIICWTPVLVENVLIAYGALPKQRHGVLKYMSIAFHLMAYFNRYVG